MPSLAECHAAGARMLCDSPPECYAIESPNAMRILSRVDAMEAYRTYEFRDEQEKYFQQMKSQMAADR